MYLECLECHKLGTTCKGPNFVAMPAHELWEWCKKRKSQLRLTNQQLADLSGTPKGTIDRLFSKEQTDFKYETIRPILPVLVGGSFEDTVCQDPQQDALVAEQIKRLEEENAKLKEKVEELKELKQEKKEEIAFLKSEVENKRKYIRVLFPLVIFLASIIILALVIDYMNSHIGFFWVDTVMEHFTEDGTNEVESLLYRIKNWRL